MNSSLIIQACPERRPTAQWARVRANARASCRALASCEGGFTLLELLVVISIIIILIGFLFPAFRGVQENAKKTQAKNDLTQIAAAVNAFYTEYGRYPVNTTSTANDGYFGSGTVPAGATSFGSNDALMDVLRNNLNGNQALVQNMNPRQIVFISPPDVKDATQPKSGIATQAATMNGYAVTPGAFVDPWGSPYNIEIDVTYNNGLTNPYGAPTSGGAGNNPLSEGVIAWSFGIDAKLGVAGNGIYKDTTTGIQSDDVISWQ